MIGKRDWVTLGLIVLAQVGLGVCYWSTQPEYAAQELPDAFVREEAEPASAPAAAMASTTAEPPLEGAAAVIQADYQKVVPTPIPEKSFGQTLQADPVPKNTSSPSVPEIPSLNPPAKAPPAQRIEPTPIPPLPEPAPAAPPIPAKVASVISAPPAVPVPSVDIPPEPTPRKTEGKDEPPTESGKDPGIAAQAKNPPPAPPAAPLAVPAADTGKPMTSVTTPAPLPPLASPMPTPQAEVKKPEPTRPCPWKLRLEIIKGRTHLTARTDKGAEFLIRCDELNMKRPLGNIEAIGKVEIITRGHEGKCDKLAISWQEDRVELQGHASWKSRHQGETLELNASQLSLRLSAVQAVEEAEASENQP